MIQETRPWLVDFHAAAALDSFPVLWVLPLGLLLVASAFWDFSFLLRLLLAFSASWDLRFLLGLLLAFYASWDLRFLLGWSLVLSAS